jgi:hypothetical protein
MINVEIRGMQINILLKDEFKKWYDSKIELISMIDETREKMRRLGLLSHN